MSSMRTDWISFPAIFWDEARNVRLKSAYDTEPIPNFDPSRHKPGLYESINLEGLKVPLTVAELDKATAEKLSAQVGHEILYRGVCGHRRSRVIATIRKGDPSRFETVPAIVWTGLTEREELQHLVDQGHVKTLNDFEQYLAVKRLLYSGLTEDQAAAQIGKSRGFVQRRRWIAAMPAVVEQEYQKRYDTSMQKEGETYVSLTDTVLQDLYKAHTADTNAGIDPAKDGSSFMEAWKKLASAGAPAKDPKSRSRKELLDFAAMVKEPIVAIVLRFAANESTANLNEAADLATSLRSVVESSTVEIAKLKLEIEDLQKQLRDATKPTNGGSHKGPAKK